jgi:hypothetical protein
LLFKKYKLKIVEYRYVEESSFYAVSNLRCMLTIQNINYPISLQEGLPDLVNITEANCYYGLGKALLKFESAVCSLENQIEAGEKGNSHIDNQEKEIFFQVLGLFLVITNSICTADSRDQSIISVFDVIKYLFDFDPEKYSYRTSVLDLGTGTGTCFDMLTQSKFLKSISTVVRFR